MVVLVEMTQNIVAENARVAQDQMSTRNATMDLSSGTIRRRLGTIRW